MKQRIVVKIGTSTLTEGTTNISEQKINDLAKQIAELHEQYDIVLVSSGAIAMARQFVNNTQWADAVKSKQALSAIGQPKLMQLYSEIFGQHNLNIAQCLVTYIDFENPASRTNMSETLHELLEKGYVPIFNENDVVAVEELILGDNDKLSALVATLIDADKLIIASDIDGLFDKNPKLHPDAKLIPQISDLKSIDQYIEEKDNGLGTGGMTSKITAVKICFEKNIPVYIVNGAKKDFIAHCLDGSLACTKFVP